MRKPYKFRKDGGSLIRWGDHPYRLCIFDEDIPAWVEAPETILSSRPALPLSYEAAKRIATLDVERYSPEKLDSFDFGPPDYEIPESEVSGSQ